MADTPRPHPRDQAVIDRFFARQPACVVCGATTWRVGATLAIHALDPVTHKPGLLGPFRVALQIVCDTCSNLLLFDTGDIPAPTGEPLSAPESGQ